MLNGYKKIYQKYAELIPNWKTMSQLELAKKCSEKGPEYESYLSALILKFWYIIDRNLYRDKGLYDETEAYDWYINAIMVVINSKPWDDPNSSVYNDKKGIERIINTCVNCDRANWFQASNRYKRKINHGLGSLELLKESYGDSFLPEQSVEELHYENYKDLVLIYFKKQQYLLSLMIDMIVNDISIDQTIDDKSLVNQIKKSIRSLPDNYSYLFAKTYNLDEILVEKSFSYIYNMSDSKMRLAIENYIYKLRSILERDT